MLCVIHCVFYLLRAFKDERKSMVAHAIKINIIPFYWSSIDLKSFFNCNSVICNLCAIAILEFYSLLRKCKIFIIKYIMRKEHFTWIFPLISSCASKPVTCSNHLWIHNLIMTNTKHETQWSSLKYRLKFIFSILSFKTTQKIDGI